MTVSSSAVLKRELRRELRARRREVTAEARRTASLRIAEKLLDSVDWPEIRSLHIYRSVPDWGEVDTEPIVRGVRERGPAIEIVSPDLSADQPIPARDFDLIVVPVLGFDEGNFRLGLGAGFYDRFLGAQPQATKIGVAYEWARVAAGLPHEPHDVPLDAIITEA